MSFKIGTLYEFNVWRARVRQYTQVSSAYEIWVLIAYDKKTVTITTVSCHADHTNLHETFTYGDFKKYFNLHHHLKPGEKTKDHRRTDYNCPYCMINYWKGHTDETTKKHRIFKNSKSNGKQKHLHKKKRRVCFNRS